MFGDGIVTRREYIIQSFGADNEYMLGYFMCQPVESKICEPMRIAFYNHANPEIYFDGELLNYILVIDDEDIIPPYRPDVDIDF